jgi:amidase
MRVGVMRFALPQNTVESFEEALRVFETLGAQLVDIQEFDTRDEILAQDRIVMLSEFRASLDNYLAGTDPALVAARSLADVVGFNENHARQELALFGQDILIEALEAPPMDDVSYLAARDRSHRLAAKEGIDRMLAESQAQLLVGATQRPAMKLDVVDRQPHVIDSACLLAAVSGYPHLTVPMRPVHGLPVGLSIVGPKWSDARVLSAGFAYEREADLSIRPKFVPSLEESPGLQDALCRQTVG